MATAKQKLRNLMVANTLSDEEIEIEGAATNARVRELLAEIEDENEEKAHAILSGERKTR